MIYTERLDIGYKNVILSDINIQLNNGNVYILIGRNGSGKSTFLKTICGEIPPLQGLIALDNIRLGTMKQNELTHLVSIVNSKFTDVDFLKVIDYIELGRSPYTGIMGKLNDLDNKMVDKVLNDLKIKYLTERFTSELSDGEKQLVSIAQSLVQDTPNIILDEPTAYLDYRNKIQTLELLKEIAKRDNKCIIISSHDIDIAIESSCPFLIIDNQKQTIDMVTERKNRNEILEKAF